MMVEDVSFVVVAKDEALVIRKCLDSLLQLELVHCEVICVDSASSDDTASIMEAYAGRDDNWSFLSVPHCRNAAEARNVGKARACRRWLFFVDGDIEVYSSFVQAALAELLDGTADAVTGGLDEVVYSDASGDRIGDAHTRRRYPERAELMSCGGTFMAARQVVDDIGDYDERFDRSQDIDYSVRLSSAGSLIGLPLMMGRHHTREYRTRPWQHVKSGFVLCQGMLARKHYRRAGFFREWFRTRKSYVVGLPLSGALLLGLLLMAAGALTWQIVAGAVLLILGFEAVYSARRKQTLPATLVIHLISPVMVLAGFVMEPYMRVPGRDHGDAPGSGHRINSQARRDA